MPSGRLRGRRWRLSGGDRDRWSAGRLAAKSTPLASPQLRRGHAPAGRRPVERLQVVALPARAVEPVQVHAVGDARAGRSTTLPVSATSSRRSVGRCHGGRSGCSGTKSPRAGDEHLVERRGSWLQQLDEPDRLGCACRRRSPWPMPRVARPAGACSPGRSLTMSATRPVRRSRGRCAPSSPRSVASSRPSNHTSPATASPARGQALDLGALQAVKLLAQLVALGLGLAQPAPVRRGFAAQELTVVSSRSSLCCSEGPASALSPGA